MKLRLRKLSSERRQAETRNEVYFATGKEGAEKWNSFPREIT
jgi:hypothetical protein